jgi:hypothetical protein
MTVLTTMDKSWVSGLVAFAGHYLSTKMGWSWITPELVGLVAGVATYWVPNAVMKPVQPPA